jgi:hypothetical protein
MSSLSSVVIDASCTADVENYAIIYVDASTTDITIEMPSLAWDGQQVHLKRIDSSGHTVTVTPASGSYCDGTSSSHTLSSMQGKHYSSLSGNWFILSSV